MTGATAAPRKVSADELAAHRWAVESQRYRVVDLDFGIRSDDPAVAAFLERVLTPFRAPGKPQHWYSFLSLEAAGSRVSVHFDAHQVLTPERHFLVGIYLWHLNQRVMLETTSFLTVHAGVVSAEGRCVLIPGDADAGKSTLVGALVAAGLEYLSDEAALLRLDAPLVAPYRRSLSLEPGSWDLLPSLRPAPDAGYDQRHAWLIPATDLHPDSPVRAHHPVAIVFPRITPGTPARLRRLSRAETVRALARGATNLAALGEAGFQAIVQTVQASTCWELSLDGVDAAVDVVRDLLTKGV